MQTPAAGWVQHSSKTALVNPGASILVQKRRPYAGNLNFEMPEDSTNAFLHWGDVLENFVLGQEIHQGKSTEILNCNT